VLKKVGVIIAEKITKQTGAGGSRARPVSSRAAYPRAGARMRGRAPAAGWPRDLPAAVCASSSRRPLALLISSLTKTTHELRTHSHSQRAAFVQLFPKCWAEESGRPRSRRARVTIRVEGLICERRCRGGAPAILFVVCGSALCVDATFGMEVLCSCTKACSPLPAHTEPKNALVPNGSEIFVAVCGKRFLLSVRKRNPSFASPEVSVHLCMTI